MQKFFFWLIVLLLAALTFVARCWNVHDVFSGGRVYFTEADAYSRMTRVRMIAEGHGAVIRHHDFENAPAGITPHTTAPLDWVILASQPLIRGAFNLLNLGQNVVVRDELLDLSGALIGPLLGTLTCFALAVALPKRTSRERWFVAAAVLLFTVSPIAVHGTLLGRPDHQALLILLLGFAMAAEIRLMESAARGWAIAAGIAWGLALWVSLYEPLILLGLTMLALAVARRVSLREPARRWEWIAMGAIFVIGIAVDGWRIQIPDAATREAFGRWRLSIGELQSLDPRSGVLWAWLGWLIVPAPFILAWRWRSSPECRVALAWLLSTVALTIWQLRWGYFLALVFAVTLPVLLAALPRAWMSWTAFVVSLWPLLGDWDQRLYPDEAEERRRYVALHEQMALRQIAEWQGARHAGIFIAPWWLSPPIAYWSRQPGVAGSSHESLPGTVDTARVYLASDASAALPILGSRKVAWILSDAPERVVPNSASLLGVAQPTQCLAYELARHVTTEPVTGSILPESGVPQPVGNQFFQVWRVAGGTQQPKVSNP